MLGGVFRNRELRRVQLAFACFNAAEWGVWIAMLVYAYDQGGATTAGLVALAQLVPAALFAPVAASLGDRLPPARVLMLGYVAQAAGMAATAAVLLADGPPLAAYACAAIAATAVTVTRPAQAVLTPALARTAEELTATNVVAGLDRESQPPGRAGARRRPARPFGRGRGVRGDGGGRGRRRAPRRSDSRAAWRPAAAAPSSPTRSSGLRVVAHEPGPRALVWLLGLQAMAIGALDVLYVVLAVAVLGHGGETAGYLNAAFGAGGVLGVIATVALVGRSRLAVAARGGSRRLGRRSRGHRCHLLDGRCARPARRRRRRPDRARRRRTHAAAAARAARGARTRVRPARERLDGGPRARVDRRAAARRCWPAATERSSASRCCCRSRCCWSPGACSPPIKPCCRSSRSRACAALPFFAPLAAPELEALARSLEQLEVPEGTAVIREGETGDRFYVVADGEVDVSVAGAHLKRLGRGDCFGEIALVRDAPRMATVTARSNCKLDVLDKDSFVTVVTGHSLSASALNELVQQRLEEAKIVS